MAISWGAFSGHLRVGIDVRTSSITSSTTSCTVYVDVYVQVDSIWNFEDNQTVTLSGSTSQTWNFFNNMGPNEVRHIGTQSHSSPVSYQGGPTYNYSAVLTGNYLGVNSSHAVSFTVPPRPASVPSQPGTPSSSDVTANSANLSWTGSTNDGGAPIETYALQVSPSSSFNSLVYNVEHLSTSRSVGGLVPATTYYARTRSRNSAGYSAWSATHSFRTLSAPSAPGAPNVSAIGATQASVSWSAPSSDGGTTITSYHLQASSTSNFSSIVHDSEQNDRSRLVTGLATSTTHYLRVRARNSSGYGPWSSITSFVTLSAAKALVNGAWVDGVPYARINGSWILATPYKQVSGQWVI